ncbi:MAG TPA: type II toxin-antitoxin system VapC family toxin [Firmicutes bacterium]|nr:type II toxin-antitoxin system VapC family toxin [Bacillota bacterium]
MRRSIGDGICIESSLVLEALRGDAGAGDLFRRWKASGKELVAPALLEYEVMAWAESQEEIRQVVANYHKLGIKLFQGRAVSERAGSLMPRLRWREAVYLAIAQVLACDIWTADSVFAERVGDFWSWVHVYHRDAIDL